MDMAMTMANKNGGVEMNSSGGWWLVAGRCDIRRKWLWLPLIYIWALHADKQLWLATFTIWERKEQWQRPSIQIRKALFCCETEISLSLHYICSIWLQYLFLHETTINNSIRTRIEWFIVCELMYANESCRYWRVASELMKFKF